MPADKTRQDLAREIRRVRNALGLTMAEFARKIGVSEATVSRWEAGKHIPESEQMEKIAKLRGKVSDNHTSGFLARYLDLRERERLAASVKGVQEEWQIGAHTVQLLADGDLWINGHVLVRQKENSL